MPDTHVVRMAGCMQAGGGEAHGGCGDYLGGRGTQWVPACGKGMASPPSPSFAGIEAMYARSFCLPGLGGQVRGRFHVAETLRLVQLVRKVCVLGVVCVCGGGVLCTLHILTRPWPLSL